MIFRFLLLAFVESIIDIDFKCKENGLIIKLSSEDTKNLQHIVEKSYVDNLMQSRFNDDCQFNGEIQKFFKFADCSKEIEDEYHSQGNLKNSKISKQFFHLPCARLVEIYEKSI